MDPKRRENVIARTVGEETVILDPSGGQVHQLNASASVIWHACDGRATPDAIARRLAERFGRRPEEVLPDVTETLAALDRLGLLERAPED